LILKTFQYATRMAIGQMARDTGYDSALLLDENDNITESSHANIFFKTSAGWVTPVSNGTILPGTVRRLLVERSPFPMRQEVVPVSILSDVKECFVSNSNLGIVPVTQIDQFSYVIGNETRELVKWIEPPPSDVPQFRLKPMA
jgi:branched-subunit amino acid aminotransferase/4-amino-4-deoxychorismate lyase